MDRNSVRIRSQVITWETGQRRWVEIRSEDIQRRESILLEKFAGIKTYLFRRKNFGKRCPECWNPTIEKATKDHCKRCMGTTFDGGYFPPVTSMLQYDATPNSNLKTYFGVFEQNQIGAWTIAFPELRPDDIIVRTGDWNLYRVDAIANTELQGRTVRQILRITQLDKSDIEYELIARNLDDFPEEYL